MRVDFAALRTRRHGNCVSPKRFVARTLAASDCILPDSSRLVRAARVALVVAMPIAALMLLICNGFDIFIVRDAFAPFMMREESLANSRQTETR